MDGLSVAASIIGVISLAMQLGQTTRKLIGFLDTIADAPNEVIRLNDLLKLIFAVSAGVVNALEHQRGHQGDGASGREHICEVLIVCLRKLTSIQDILDKSERLQGGSRTSRGWGRLKLAMKKDEILDLERQLGQALSVLNVLLTTSIMYDNISRAAALTSPIMSSLSSSAPNVDDGHHQHHSGTNASPYVEAKRVNKSSQMSKLNTTLSQLYLCHGGQFSLCCERRTRRQVVWDSETNESRDELYKETFGLSLRFLSTSIELVVSRLCFCSPSLGLRLQHIVSRTTWRSHIYDVMKNDDVKGLRKLIDKGLCTLDSCSEAGWTILESAEIFGISNVAVYLQSQGCELRTTSAYFTLSKSGMMRKRHLSQSRFRSISQKLDLVEYDPEDIIPTQENVLGMDGLLLLDALQWLASTGSLQTSLPVSDYFGSLLCIVRVWWGKLESDGSREQLRLLVSRLISRCGNVHHLDRLGRTPLQCLLRYMHPEDDSFIISHWLSLLSNGQVDVRKYLKEECRTCPRSFDTFLQTWYEDTQVYVSLRPRKITMSILEDNQTDLKMMFVDPSSTAVEVLQELAFLPEVCIKSGTECKYMRCWFELWKRDSDFVPAEGKSFQQILHQWISERSATSGIDSAKNQSLLPRPDQVQSAIDTGELDTLTFAKLVSRFNLCHCDLTGKYLELWPFNGNTHTMCQSGNLIGRACLDQSTWCPMHFCRFNHERFKRKQKMKWMKRTGIKTIKVPQVPGGWVE